MNKKITAESAVIFYGGESIINPFNGCYRGIDLIFTSNGSSITSVYETASAL